VQVGDIQGEVFTSGSAPATVRTWRGADVFIPMRSSVPRKSQLDVHRPRLRIDLRITAAGATTLRT